MSMGRLSLTGRIQNTITDDVHRESKENRAVNVILKLFMGYKVTHSYKTMIYW